MDTIHIPKKQGLYDPSFEHDSCGVGFVCDIKGIKSHDIILKGLEVLERLSHRGAVGADPNTGDGAGITIQFPYKFFKEECLSSGKEAPGEGSLAAGLVFLPTDIKEKGICEETLEECLKEQGLEIAVWRNVPVNDSIIGETAKKSQPVFKNIIVGRGSGVKDQKTFEVRLYIARKKAENIIRVSGLKQKNSFYIVSLSSKTFCFKGLLMPKQLRDFFVDLKDERLVSCLALVHSRYSTNTFPTWDLAQPFRYLAHNGEINTLRGNINWMGAREKMFESGILGPEIKKILPVIVPGGSDSASLDNAFELLVLAGRSLPHAMMMLVPAVWQKNDLMDPRIRDFYEYHSCLMEAWDGPAALCFTDGEMVGGLLDRNGLRPNRYVITNDGFVVMASEVGVLDIPPDKIIESGRLSPGKMFIVDTKQGRIIDDKEIKQNISTAKPYGKWLKENIVELSQVKSHKTEEAHIEDLSFAQNACGYTREDLKMIIKPMIEKGQEPVGSMGNDTPLAVLSEKPQLLFNYFKQLFAQVTNPPIDPIREDVVMSLETKAGPGKNILEDGPCHTAKLKVIHPVLNEEELQKIRAAESSGFKTKVISTVFNAGKKEAAFKTALENVFLEADKAIDEGCSFLILSDRGIDKENAALPSLLCTAGLHHHLLRKGTRTKVAMIIESAEPREVMHFALLFGYGADLVCPYLALQTVEQTVKEDNMDISSDEARKNYLKAIEKGILKVLSKMGISLLQSYRGAQIFEALGLGPEVINGHFSGTVSRIGGIDLNGIAKETLIRHSNAVDVSFSGSGLLSAGGNYQWRRDGEYHLWNPETIAAFQQAVREENFEKFLEYSRLVNEQKGHLCTLRGTMKFKEREPIPLEEVEPVEEIVKRFVTGAMSFGSISKEAHETIAIAMNRLGGKSNSGEGGEDPNRFIPLANGDSKKSKIKQVASGRFGVSSNYLVNAEELQIKIAQGAKPGEGGQLPGHKVDMTIAKIRYSTPGVTLISPPPHHDIYSIEDLAQLIFDLKNANPDARISVKLVSEIGVGTIAAGVAKGHADMILISGGEGGTGASPLSSIKHAGLPWDLGLAETHQTLVLNDLRSRVRLQTDGQMRTGRDIVIAAILGAEEFGFATSALVAMGCTLLRHCHMNNCSLGIATQDEALRRRFAGKPQYIINMMRFLAEDARRVMASLGIRKIDELIGRADLLEINEEVLNWKAKSIDLSKIFFVPEADRKTGRRYLMEQDHGIDDVLDIELIKRSKNSLEKMEKTSIELTIKNHNRTAGAMLSSFVSKLHGERGLNDDTVNVKFTGVAGQSFGAFLAKGITFELEGSCNDYVGKGLSGGKIIVYPDKNSKFVPEDNIIIGNTTFYGATSGDAYIRGQAGERFCIRNSGLFAVVEGVGDHGCEYMTGGRVLILGKTGRNFAAGMSGGIAYVYDIDKKFGDRCNTSMVDLERCSIHDESTIKYLLQNHYKYTKSGIAKHILENFNRELKHIVKVIPKEYKDVLKAMGSYLSAQEETTEG